MQIASTTPSPRMSELDLMAQLLPLSGARVVELGCGRGQKTRAMAKRFQVRELIAAEVDAQALAFNLAQEPTPRVRFSADGAQSISEPDASVDIVVMFKSLHHVPLAELPVAMGELARVLKPGGYAYISEPVFAGELNEVIRLFHDEEEVRQAAFAAVAESVESGLFELQGQHFFTAQVEFQSFEEFADGIIHATHSQHHLSAAQLRAVQTKFESFRSASGFAFATPNRVDLLRRPE